MTHNFEDRITALEKKTHGVAIENFYIEKIDDNITNQITVQYSNGIQIIYGSCYTNRVYLTKFLHPFKRLFTIDYSSTEAYPFVVGVVGYGNAPDMSSVINTKVYTPGSNKNQIQFRVSPAGTVCWMAMGYWK